MKIPQAMAPRLKLLGVRSTVLFSGVGVLASSLARVVVAVILARALGPSEYDAIAVGALYLGLIVLALDPGVSVALVQIRELSSSHLAAATAISLLGGGIVSAATLAVCIVFIQDSALLGVMSVVAVVPLLRGLGLVPQSLLFRDRRMRVIASGEAVAAAVQVIGTLIGVAIAPGPLAYAVPVVVSELLLMVAWTRMAGGVSPRFEKGAARELWALASRNATTNMSNVLSRNVDMMIVGWVFGPTALSLYSIAYRFLWLPVQLIGQVVSRVAVPEFAASIRESRPIGASLLRATARLSILAALAITPVALAGPFIVILIFGPAWVSAGPIVSLLSVAGMVQTATYLLRAAWSALGKVSFLARFSVVAAGLSILGFLMGALVGLLWVPAAYLVVFIGLLPRMVNYTAEVCDVPRRQLWRAVLYGWPVLAVQTLILLPIFGSPLRGQDVTLAVGLVGLAGSLLAGALVALLRLRRSVRLSQRGVTEGVR
ncbi:oligosaccharide flippase family protein [Micromonospora sp. DPT]|uniref:oligosaccharide flippase family protein n=1 Tax=Micromonospora sp. DPT TaxID=3142975 RepID=UPI0032098A3D